MESNVKNDASFPARRYKAGRVGGPAVPAVPEGRRATHVFKKTVNNAQYSTMLPDIPVRLVISKAVTPSLSDIASLVTEYRGTTARYLLFYPPSPLRP